MWPRKNNMITSDLNHKACLTSSTAAEAVTEDRRALTIMFIPFLIFQYCLAYRFKGLTSSSV